MKTKRKNINVQYVSILLMIQKIAFIVISKHAKNVSMNININPKMKIALHAVKIS